MKIQTMQEMRMEICKIRNMVLHIFYTCKSLLKIYLV